MDIPARRYPTAPAGGVAVGPEFRLVLPVHVADSSSPGIAGPDLV